MGKVRNFLRQLFSACIAQGFSLLQSIFMSFVVAKILSNEIFAWWQWFLFLAGLTHYIHIGVGEGILLRYGGKSYDEINYDEFSSMFKSYSLMQFCILLFVIIASHFYYGYTQEGICVFIAALFMVAANLSYFLSQLLIATNQTSKYSKAVMLNKGFMFVASSLLIITGYRNYVWFCIMYCIGQYIEFACCILRSKEIVFNSTWRLRDGFCEILSNAKVGYALSISNFSANMVTNVGRGIVMLFGSLLNFGSLSLANSLSNFFLMFVKQIGTVIYPFLRGITSNQQKRLFVIAQDSICILTFGLLVCYYPVRLILGYWLPNYADSLIYLGYIMPVVVLDATMSAINTPYLNSMRKERFLLFINLTAFLSVAIISTIAVVCFDSLEIVALAIPIGMAIKSMSSTIYIGNIIDAEEKKVRNICMSEIVLILIFLFSIIIYNYETKLLYISAYVIYLVAKRNTIAEVVRLGKNLITKKGSGY